jgi:hypothetical protein
MIWLSGRSQGLAAGVEGEGEEGKERSQGGESESNEEALVREGGVGGCPLHGGDIIRLKI